MSTMKMSEAMAIGSLLHPQAFNVLFDEEWNYGELSVKASCALGAACEAIGIDDIHNAPRGWSELLNAHVGCPDSACSYWRHSSVNSMIVHLNDGHRWSREQIADWLRDVEAQVEQPAGEVAEEVEAVPV